MNKLQNQIEKKEQELKILKEKLSKEQEILQKRDTIEIDGYEYETKEHDFNKTLSEIEIPKGWELWTYEDCIKLHNNLEFRKSLNLENCWFFIKQPFKFNEEKGYVAGFIANSDWADLDCIRYPSYSNPALGIRFKKRINKHGKK